MIELIEPKIFVTSDTHFQHIKSFLYEPRGFQSIQEHDEKIIENWNNIINSQDIIYFLGDFALCRGEDEIIKNAINTINKLNGTIHWIFGNHDNDRLKDEFSNNCPNIILDGYSTMLKYKKYHFYLSHYPTICSNFDNDRPLKSRIINLCGHSHTTDPFIDWNKYNSAIFHCEMDTHNCIPWNLDEIIELIKEKNND